MNSTRICRLVSAARSVPTPSPPRLSRHSPRNTIRQRFHLDEEEGRKSLFGGLVASGWHVGSACMKTPVADGQRRTREAQARGEKVATWGPSPGFRDLRWICPVLAGDTISFSTVIESKRVSESRPGWGILQSTTSGVNQRGEEVYSVKATAFVPMRRCGRSETCRRSGAMRSIELRGAVARIQTSRVRKPEVLVLRTIPE